MKRVSKINGNYEEQTNKNREDNHNYYLYTPGKFLSDGGFRVCTFGSKCCGKLKIVGTASSFSHTCPNFSLSKHSSSKCFEHILEYFVGTKLFLLIFWTHTFTLSSSFGKLKHKSIIRSILHFTEAHGMVSYYALQ